MSQGNHPSIIGEAISKGLTPEVVDKASVTARASRAALDEQELARPGGRGTPWRHSPTGRPQAQKPA